MRKQNTLNQDHKISDEASRFSKLSHISLELNGFCFVRLFCYCYCFQRDSCFELVHFALQANTLLPANQRSEC